MSRDLFQTLRRFFHINIPYGQPDNDRLFNVRPFFDALRDNMLKIDKEEHLNVDEFMIPFKGRNKLKQYIKNKPHKWGIKVFGLCGSSGMLYDFQVYTGKDTVTEKTKLGISGDIVMKLVQTIPVKKNYTLYTDNWFTSYHLAAELHVRDLLMVVTVKENSIPKRLHKNLPKSPFTEDENDLKKRGGGSFTYATDDKNITAVKWLDNKCVTLLSNFVGVKPVQEVKRWSTSSNSHIVERQT
ncbi:hypothetical protein JTE90_022889 [Oedothorax gibbosus]|uniref:PiggyBac transposable element-derived protein domain-containing protein n=1 Tax=Oedothorax gibbosus TaxID=931172 RepID=A0AAV6UVE8_9ARAC|nr:hypothetical protein JTE90_022889 [Oedothorax gibbosus]